MHSAYGPKAFLKQRFSWSAFCTELLAKGPEPWTEVLVLQEKINGPSTYLLEFPKSKCINWYLFREVCDGL